MRKIIEIKKKCNENRWEKKQWNSNIFLYFFITKATQNLSHSIKTSAQINELFILRLFPPFSFWLTINTYSFIYFPSYKYHSFSKTLLFSAFSPFSHWKLFIEGFFISHTGNRSRMCYKRKIVIYCISFRN